MRLLIFTLFYFFSFTLYAQSWNQIIPPESISARANASMIYHPTEEAIYLFGGQTTAGRQNDLWKFDLTNNTWTEIQAVGDIPSIRHTQNAVFNESENQMLIFSGQGNGLYNDVWSFNFNTLQWTEKSPNGNTDDTPQQRYGTATVYDPIGFRLVTFGGFGNAGTARQDDTWSFDLLGNQWNEVTTPTHPLKRCLHNGTYIPDRHLMVIYGGQSSGNQEDIWTFDLSLDTWTERTPSLKPPGRHFCSVTAIDEDRLYVFGGNGANQNNFSGALNDLWQFSLVDDTWVEIIPDNDPPPARVGHCAVTIPTTGQLYVFGGNGSDGGLLNDIWVFEDFTNSNETPITINKSIQFEMLSANPLQSNLQFNIQLEKAKNIQLLLTDINGRNIQELLNQHLSAGTHSFSKEITFLSSGLYFLQINTEKGIEFISKLVKE